MDVGFGVGLAFAWAFAFACHVHAQGKHFQKKLIAFVARVWTAQWRQPFLSVCVWAHLLAAAEVAEVCFKKSEIRQPKGR